MLTNSNPYLEQRLTYILCNKRLATFPSPAGFFSSLPNWDSTTPSYAGECVPPRFRGRDTLARGRWCGGCPNSDEGTSRHCGILGIPYMYFVMEPYAIISLSLYLCGCVQALRGRAVAPQLRAAREPPGGRESPPTRRGGGEGEGSLAPCLLAPRLTQPRLTTLPQGRMLLCNYKDTKP
jgi:hypothetical protein